MRRTNTECTGTLESENASTGVRKDEREGGGRADQGEDRRRLSLARTVER